MNLLDKARNYALPVLSFRDVIVDRAKGSMVWDVHGREYLDLNSGQYCSIFGHSDPELANLFSQIFSTAQDTDTGTLSVSVIEALANLSSRVPEMELAQGILLSTGGEANEFALKYAKHLTKRDGVLGFDRGYHGLSHGVAAYGISRTKVRPTLPKSFTVPAPTDAFGREDGDEEALLEQLEAEVEENWPDIAAMIFEPIISGGGVLFPSERFFRRARELCDAHGILLIFDECQTGIGRLGAWFGYQKLGVTPDMLVLAKALGAGFPVSAVLMRSSVVPAAGFEMKYFSSHQNEAYSGAIVNHVLNRISSENLLPRVIERGSTLLELLKRIEVESGQIFNVRGEGLLVGFDLTPEPFGPAGSSQGIGDNFVKRAEENGLLLQHCNLGRTVRLLPNYYVSDNEFDLLDSRLRASVKGL